MAYTKLDVRERRLIEDLSTAKASVSTICQEIKRNRVEDEELPKRNGSFDLLARKTASQRRHRQRKLVRCADILGAVLEGLTAGWSPEQIAGWMQRERQPRSVSHETIYACVHSPDGQSEELARCLPERCERRQPRGTVLPPDRAIGSRPEDIAMRETFGDWEGDPMIFQKDLGAANVASPVERKTRDAVPFRNNDRSSKMPLNRLIALFPPLPATARCSFGDGSVHRTEAWFCDPSAPRQKESVENLNKRARRYLPRATPVAALTDRSMTAICERPRAPRRESVSATRHRPKRSATHSGGSDNPRCRNPP